MNMLWMLNLSQTKKQQFIDWNSGILTNAIVCEYFQKKPNLINNRTTSSLNILVFLRDIISNIAYFPIKV